MKYILLILANKMTYNIYKYDETVYDKNATKMKTIDDIVKIFDPTDKNIGNTHKLILFIQYLVNNNIVNCVDIPTFKPLGIGYEKYKLAKLLIGSVILYGDNSKNLYPSKEQLVEYVSKSEKQYMFYNLALVKIKDIGMGHSNLIIIDKKRKIVERFEPHGKMEFFDDMYIDTFIVDNFLIPLKSLSEKYKYIHPLDYCPSLGPQSKQKLSNKDEKGSFCITWSTLYLHIKFINPELSSNIIIDYLINKSADDLQDLVERYQTFIDFVISDNDI